MSRYVVFLRGVNVSGKNKLPMAELKQALERLGCSAVKTYLNSGNAAFSCGDGDTLSIAGRIEEMIEEMFSIIVPCFVIEQEELKDILNNAPSWWGTNGNEVYHNLIFIIPPLSAYQVCHELGEPKEGLEQVATYNNSIFWSFNRQEYRKTNWWAKTATADIADRITIRTANTVRKISRI